MSEMQICPTCDGCGRVADDDDRTPWKYWEVLTPPADFGVRMGLVKPTTCPDCGGSGRQAVPVCPHAMTFRARDGQRCCACGRLVPAATTY